PGQLLREHDRRQGGGCPDERLQDAVRNAAAGGKQRGECHEADGREVGDARVLHGAEFEPQPEIARRLQRDAERNARHRMAGLPAPECERCGDQERRRHHRNPARPCSIFPGVKRTTPGGVSPPSRTSRTRTSKPSARNDPTKRARASSQLTKIAITLESVARRASTARASAPNSPGALGPTPASTSSMCSARIWPRPAVYARTSPPTKRRSRRQSCVSMV